MPRPPTYDPHAFAAVVAAHGGSITAAAAAMGVPRTTVYRVLSRLPLEERPAPSDVDDDVPEHHRPVVVVLATPCGEPEPGTRPVPFTTDPDDGRVRVPPSALVELAHELRTARAVLARGDVRGGESLVASATRRASLLASIPTGDR